MILYECLWVLGNHWIWRLLGFFLESISECCWDAPLEVVTLSLTWPPLEVAASYCSGADVCSGTTCLGWGNTLRDAGGKDSTVRQFANIFRQIQLPLVVNRICCWVHL